jgi:predicted O-methyltransferase YrrM
VSGLPAALEAVRDVEGWMTDAQARRLWARASELAPPATVVEIGSYRGRSAIVLARAAAEGVAVIAIDPHAGNDRGPREIHGTAAEGEADHEAFLANLAAAGVGERVRHVRLPSQEALGAVEGAVDLLYVDGAHRYGPARADLKRWGDRVRPGGTMLVHDAFSSVGVTLALLRGCLFSRSLRYVGRDGSLAEYRREPGGLGSALRQLAQLPWFARNLVLKALIVLKLRRGPWPY